MLIAEQYLQHIHALPCVCCFALERTQDGPTFAHHIRTGQGAGQRADHFLSIPLCHDCHQGVNGIHGNKTYLHLLDCTELDLLAVTVEILFRMYQGGIEAEHLHRHSILRRRQRYLGAERRG